MSSIRPLKPGDIVRIGSHYCLIVRDHDGSLANVIIDSFVMGFFKNGELEDIAKLVSSIDSYDLIEAISHVEGR